MWRVAITGASGGERGEGCMGGCGEDMRIGEVGGGGDGDGEEGGGGEMAEPEEVRETEVHDDGLEREEKGWPGWKAGLRQLVISAVPVQDSRWR